MKAITLTCDKYIKLVDHMIFTYEKVWPSHPFTFRVPHEDYPEFLVEKYQDKIELIQLKDGKIKSIKETLLTSIQDLDDQEWIYWCMDDGYLIQLREKEANDIYQTVIGITDPTVCAVRLMRCRARLKDKFIKKGGEIFTKLGQELLEIIYTDTNELCDIWEHQFVRVKLLRNLFESFPDRPFKAKEMDTFPLTKGYGEKCYIPAKNLVVFGESTSRGELTENCVASFKKWGLEIPKGFTISNKYHLSGQLPYNILGQEVTLPKKLQAKVTELTRWYWRKRVGNV
jgi:hypothetical protein